MDWSSLLSSPLIGVVGTLLGAIVGSSLTSARDRRRYGRELLTSVLDRRTAYRGDVCSAIDFLIITYGNAGDAAMGLRSPLAPDRLDGAEARWREVLTRKYVYAEPRLQEAMTAVDVARDAAVRAITRKDAPSILLSRQRLDAARLTVLDAVQEEGQELNEAIAYELALKRTRLKHAILRRPLVEPALLPSAVAAAGQAASPER